MGQLDESIFTKYQRQLDLHRSKDLLGKKTIKMEWLYQSPSLDTSGEVRKEIYKVIKFIIIRTLNRSMFYKKTFSKEEKPLKTNLHQKSNFQRVLKTNLKWVRVNMRFQWQLIWASTFPITIMDKEIWLMITIDHWDLRLYSRPLKLPATKGSSPLRLRITWKEACSERTWIQFKLRIGCRDNRLLMVKNQTRIPYIKKKLI